MDFGRNDSRVVFFGDWHANYDYAEKAIIEAIEKYKPDLFIHVGDFGFGFGGFEEEISELLDIVNMDMIVCSGNHENYNKIEEYEIGDDGYRKISRHLFFATPKARLKIGGRTIAFFPGAHSIDRSYRVKDISYWEQEDPTEEDLETLKKAGKADVLVSHEAPIFLGKESTWWAAEDIEASRKARKLVEEAIWATGAELNVHGHHHKNYRTFLGDVAIIALASDATGIIDNIFCLNPLE